MRAHSQVLVAKAHQEMHKAHILDHEVVHDVTLHPLIARN
jgi:hypothetical protein